MGLGEGTEGLGEGGGVDVVLCGGFGVFEGVAFIFLGGVLGDGSHL